MTTVLTTATPTSATTTAGDPVTNAIAWARSQIGKPYQLGAAGPDKFDCSGLVQQAYKAAGVTLPRTTAQMIGVGTKVEKANLQAGDLVFPIVGHVQLYTERGDVIESPKPGKTVREVPMWGYYTARRVVDSAGVSQANINIPIVGPVLDAASSAASSVLNAGSSILGLGDLESTVMSIGLKLLFVAGGAGLVLLGLARTVGPKTSSIASSLQGAMS